MNDLEDDVCDGRDELADSRKMSPGHCVVGIHCIWKRWRRNGFLQQKGVQTKVILGLFVISDDECCQWRSLGDCVVAFDSS
ncbi:hypothetical protein Tco_0805961 [Tanacetum coccineum]